MMCIPVGSQSREAGLQLDGRVAEGRGRSAGGCRTPGMEAQLRLQQETSEKLSGVRKQHGALTFGSVEATPVVENGEVKGLLVREHNAAENIIESFMVAAMSPWRNTSRKKALCPFAGGRTPKRWDRIREIAAQFGTKLPAEPDAPALSGFLEQRQKADPVHFPDLSLSVVKLLGPENISWNRQGQNTWGILDWPRTITLIRLRRIAAMRPVTQSC